MCAHVCPSMWKPKVDPRCLLWLLFSIWGRIFLCAQSLLVYPTSLGGPSRCYDNRALSLLNVRKLVHVYDKIWSCPFLSTLPPPALPVLPAPLPDFMILVFWITHQIPLCIGSGDSNSIAHTYVTSVLFCELSALVLEF